MIEVGLYPSSTGKPVGRMTGYSVADFAVRGGPFEVATRELLAEGFKLRWHGRTRGAGGELATEAPPDQLPASGRRSKYTCPGCRQNAWAKPGARLICGACEKQMKTVAAAGCAAAAR